MGQLVIRKQGVTPANYYMYTLDGKPCFCQDVKQAARFQPVSYSAVVTHLNLLLAEKNVVVEAITAPMEHRVANH